MNLHDEAMRRLGRPNVPDLQAELAAAEARIAALERERRALGISAEGTVGPMGVELLRAQARIAELERENEQVKAHYKATAEGIMQCIDASWGMFKGRDWSRPELVLAEYTDELKARIAALETIIRDLCIGHDEDCECAGCRAVFRKDLPSPSADHDMLL